ncbi:MAG: single-stranded DNA-binding protein [Bacteriovoracaceae bacterium]|nr:single-stranded DNA-binding protein [Bacteriovoracaceae bacterium]
MSVNKVIILGRLGQDPELKYTPTGSAVCNFSVATSDNWTDKSGQKQEKTEWHRVVVWGKLAELCNQYLSKGRQVFLEGKLQTRSWDDKDGNKRYTTEVLANTVQFIGATQGAGAGASASNEYNQEAPARGENTERASGSAAANSNSNYANISTDASFAADDIPF